LGCSDRGLHFQLKIAPLPEMDEEAIFMLIDLIRSAQKDDEHAMLQLINRFDKLFQKYGRKLRYEDAKNDLIVDFIELIKTFDFEKINNTSDGAIVNFLVKSTYRFYLKHLEIFMNKSNMEVPLCDLDSSQVQILERRLAMQDSLSVSELFPKNVLTLKEQKILIAIYQEGRSVSDVAAFLHVSRQNINQIKKRAESKIRKKLRYNQN
jgi:DNA-directed RNA polymerase specialized sigma subunit